MIKFEIKGADELAKWLKQWPKETKNKINTELFRIVNELRNNIIRQMQITPRNPARGYRRGGKIHYPSKEGNAPAIDSGNLARSINIAAHIGWAELFVRGAPYVEYLENEKTLNRPVFFRELDKMRVEERIKARILT